MAKIGFIGVGNMGGPMAANLIKDGHEVKAYDVVGQTLSRIVNAGAIQASDPADAVSDVEAVVTMLPAGQHVNDVYVGAGKVLANLAPGTLLIDSSTIDVATSRAMHAAAVDAAYDMLDAPVSGGQAGAENGALTVMIGGDQSDFDKAKDKIDCYSKKMKLLGKAGSGQLAKMVNQICIAGLVQGLSEGINFGMKAGLNMEDVIEVISKGAAQSWQMDNRYKTMIDDKFDFGFAVDWMRKDLKIAMDEAKNNGSLLPITEIIDKYYGEVQELGGKRWDTSSLIKRFRK